MQQLLVIQVKRVGVELRKSYESTKIQTEKDFKEELNHVLFNC